MLYPDLELFDGAKKQMKEQFYKTIEEAQETEGDDCFDPLIKSMESLVNTVLETKG